MMGRKEIIRVRLVKLPDVVDRKECRAPTVKVRVAQVLTSVALVLCSASAFAAFEESGIPVAVKTLYCDSNPRILVQFADASKNVWYPANAGDQSKAFLATAMAAKLAGRSLYYYGAGDPAALTTYCINVSARKIEIFGLD